MRASSFTAAACPSVLQTASIVLQLSAIIASWPEARGAPGGRLRSSFASPERARPRVIAPRPENCITLHNFGHAFNKYDHEIYEHAHRLFCSRLQSAGLRGDEAVEAELASSNLCGALDFSKVDDVCGRLETRDVLLKKAAHDARCAHRGPGAQPRVADESIGGLFSRLRGA